MLSSIARLLPSPADNTLRGFKLPWYVFTCLALLSAARSLIYLLAPDGGARGWVS